MKILPNVALLDFADQALISLVFGARRVKFPTFVRSVRGHVFM